MVVAVGLNPAIDRILIVPRFAVGKTLKAESVETLPSGKGANVAAVFRLLDVDVRFVGFVGRDDVPAYRRRLEGVPCDLVEIDGRTRIDTTIIDPPAGNRVGSETHVREPGFAVSHDDLDRFWGAFAQAVRGAELVTLSGSLPPGAPADTYRRIILYCRERGVRTFLDTSDEPLRLGAEAVPTLMKPNDEELEELVGHPVREVDAMVRAARELIARGVEAVAVSLGAEGAILVERDEAWRGKAEAPEVVNTVGCGDAFAVGWLAARLRGESPAEQLREALALGAANAMTHGAGVIKPDNIALMRERASVRAVERA